MKKSKLAPISGPASIILGIIGIATGIYYIGGLLAIVGLLLGFICYLDTGNKIVAYIGIVLCNVAITWTWFFYYVWDLLP